MGYYINASLGYYEGDKIDVLDLEVLQRPSVYHEFINGDWVLNQNKAQEKIQLDYKNAVQRRLDEFAQSRNYNNILSAATYATSTISRFKTEGQYCVNVRDATWAKCYEILQDIQLGKREIPSIDQFLSELPALAWPPTSGEK